MVDLKKLRELCHKARESERQAHLGATFTMLKECTPDALESLLDVIEEMRGALMDVQHLMGLHVETEEQWTFKMLRDEVIWPMRDRATEALAKLKALENE